MKKIAVLGAGGTGQAIAADLTLAGYPVSLYESADFRDNIAQVRQRGGISLVGAGRQGFARLQAATTDAGEALDGAEIVFIAAVATRHAEMAGACAPHLKGEQTIVISPGNAGSLVFDRELEKRASKARPLLAEVEGNLYPCRLTGPGEVLVALPSRPRFIAAYPARHTHEVIDRLDGTYQLRPAANVLEAALNSPNLVNHLAPSLLNLGAIEQSGGKFYLYRQGLTPSILRCVEAVHGERQAILRALNYADRSRLDFLRALAHDRDSPELELFRGLIGPSSVQHRYITEDAPTGISLMISLGELAGVPTPVAKALLTLASAIHQVDYLRSGRTLENLGLGGLTVAELNQLLTAGKR